MVVSLSNDVLIHGSVFQYARNDGQLVKSRRWACVTSDSLFVFPDAYNSSACYKVFLEQADIGISYEDDDNPWITIAERNNSLYYIQPEKAYQFNKWFSAIQRAANPYKGSSRPDSRAVKPFNSFTKLNTNSVFTSDTGKPESHFQPVAVNQLRAPKDRYCPPTIPKRITLPWNKVVDNTLTTTDWSPQFARKCRSPTGSTSRPVDRIFTDMDDAPPPRPPRSRLDLQTVKEHPNMRESDVLTTKPLSEIRNLYPVSGLAKRMSISASDLLGKSRDDLILLLLQLNREKANLQRWYDYFMQQMELIRSTKGLPFLVRLIHLLSAHEVVPPKPSLNFARDIEEQDVARTLNASRRNFHSIPSLQTGLSNESVNLADWIAQTEMTEAEEASVRRLSHSGGSSLSAGRPFESAAVRQRRIQLEAELADLEALCAPHKVLHQQLRLTQKAIHQNEKTKESRGPAATLLRRLRMNQTDHVNRSSTEIRSRDFQDNFYHDENEPFHNSNQLLATTESHRRVSQPCERGQFSTSAFNSGRFTPIGSKQSFEQDSFLKRFRSIPDHIDLLSVAGYPTDRLQLRNMNWKSRPSSPSLTSSNLEDLTTKFAPVRSSMTKQENQNLPGDGPDPQPIDAISQRGGLNTARSTPVNQPHWSRKLSQDSGDIADSFARRDCTPQNVSRSDSMNAITPVASSHTLSPPRYEPYRRRRTDSSPGSTQLEKFPATRMQLHFDELLHDADKPWNSNAESQRARRLRLGQDSSDSLERRRVEWSDNYNSELPVPVNRSLENSALRMQFVSSFTNSASSVLPGRANNRPSEIKRLDTDTPWVEEQIIPVTLKPKQSLRTDAIIAQSGNNSETTNKLNTTEDHRKYHSRKTRLESSPPRKPTNEPLVAIDAITGCRLSAVINDEDDVESLLMETPQSSDEPDHASRLHSDVDRPRHPLETRRLRTNRDLEVKYDDAMVLPSAKIKTSGSLPTTNSVMLKRGKPATPEYHFTSESIESVFSPPEPMEIRERYVPSPPPFERCDSEYRRNKEVKMNALRNVLLRQSFAGDSVQDFDQEQREEFPGHRADWIKQRTQLLSMQHRLAKEAVESAGNITDGSYLFNQ
ncbi:hypothetical protein EG68_08531 [Paragonimus skrjabini miyazakii]|uniref:PH domain-containing protein n=1 Tax=Paragonimus skrjabini miyazakii TaxID=59628 RepID=A0A8S9YGL6_9TREM|nr:hypothetical protein EG68_08531 [Paragonimus skrjabini miyazakii]